MNVIARPRLSTLRLLACLMALCVGGAIAAPASQGNDITLWEATPSSTQAGGHPDLQIHVSFGNRATCPECSDVRDFIQQLPTGFTGSRAELPQCSLAQFATKECPPDTQIGVYGLFGLITPPYSPEGEYEPIALYSPLYNLPPHPGEAANIGFVAPIISFTSQIG